METQIGEANSRSSAFHFFLFLVMFFALGFVAFGSSAILFQIVNKFFPDPLSYATGYFDQGGVRFGIAALFIAGPLYFFLARMTNRFLQAGDIAKDSKVRRWLTYIVLFFAAGTLIGDLVTLVNNFLSGDIAVNFLLKVLIVLVVAGGIFGYYIRNIGRQEFAEKSIKEDRIFALSFGVLIVVVFLSGFFFIDTPALAREKKQDQATAMDLQNLDSAIREYFNSVGKLPEKLDELKQGSRLPVVRQGSELVYEKKTDSSYELCANFVRSNLNDPMLGNAYEVSTKEWEHTSGKVCFRRIIEQQKLTK